MAASANPSGAEDRSDATHNRSANPSNGAAAAGSAAGQGLKNNPGLATEWSNDEQAIFEEGLSKYASESVVMRYAKIALSLPGKTVRDVALRCRWMSKKENGKRRKEDHNLSRKNKDKKERVADSSAKPAAHIAARPGVAPYALPMLPMENDDEISFKAIGGHTGQLLEQNAQMFNQIHTNLANYQVHENIGLFCQARDNIRSILNDMNDMPGVMKQMPSLPVKMNEELANSILPPRPAIPSMAMQS